MASVKVVPCGTSTETVSRKQKVLAAQEKIAQRASERGVLLVRVKDLPSSDRGTGMLTERQKQWLNTSTYDSKTENPVLHRRTVELSKPSKHAKEREEACMEVQGLTDDVNSVPPSGVAEKIQESRKARHEQTLDDMKQELAVISEELEPLIQKASELLNSQLSDNDQVITSIFARVDSSELLQEHSLDQLHSLWSEVTSQSVCRQQCIHALDHTLCSVEEQRQKMVTEVLKSYAHQLEVIAYLLPADVHRLIEEEAHTINMAIITNRRSYTQLCLHLMTADFARMKEYRQKWEAVVTDWRDLICKLTLNRFIAFIESGEVVTPPELERQKELLAAEQTAVNRRRRDLIQQVVGFRPPSGTKSAIYEWKENVEKLNQQLQRIHSNYLLQFQSSQEAVVRCCEDKMEQCREYLVSSGAFDTNNVYKVMSQHFLPLVEQIDQRMRAELQSMERSLDLMLGTQAVQFRSLYQYGQGAAHLWDTHAVTLEERERAFQEDLEKCRHQHDMENQNLEANLDVLLDRLRQSASKEVLDQFLGESLKMLETIKEGYLSFHSSLSEEAKKLPDIIQQELDSYDAALCKYFGVDRSPPKNSRSKSQLNRAPSELITKTPKKSLRRSSRGKTSTDLHHPRLSVTPAHPTSEKKNLSSIVGEVISTSHGTSFYIHNTTSSDGLHGAGTFLTQDEESEGASLTFATENITILDQAFVNARNGLRLGFLDHLEQWKLETSAKAHESVSGKVEEANTELDLRLHLHEPRPSRIEQDLHHVRAAELESHRDRVSRHSQGVIASINEQKATIQNLMSQQEMESDKFATEVMMLESQLDSADKSNKLQIIQDQAKHLLELHLQYVSSISSNHQNLCEEILGELEASNQSYKASLKMFSEGGNYCPEEVELYSKRLNKLSSKVAAARVFIGNEVNLLTKTHSEAAWEIMKQFEASYLLHSADLSFLEAMSQTLTSAQVGIKSEVARSNGQAREIFQNMDRISALTRQVQAKELPRSTLLSELSEFFTVLTKRTDYLFCHSVQLRGARVGSQADVVPAQSVAKSSGAPISAVNITKSILEQTSARKSMDASVDKDLIKRQALPAPSPAIIVPPQMGSEPVTSVAGTTSGMLQPNAPEARKKSGRQSISSRRRTLAMERKHATFGIGGGDDGTDCFLPQVRAVLKSSHQVLYSEAESYYKLKGTRAPTRPSEIQESFEACIDSLILKCQQYRVQAEEYRNDCIEEFHHQLDAAMDILELVPGVVFADVSEEQMKLFDEQRRTQSSAHSSHMEEFSATKKCHEKSLRPTLGHPSQREQLDDLCTREDDRHNAIVKCSHDHALASKANETQYTVKFILELVETTKSLLSLFDSCLTSVDIIPGSDRHKSKPPVEKLIRLHISQQHGTSEGAEDSSNTGEAVTRLIPSKLSGKTNSYLWPSLPESERTAIMEMLPPPPSTSSKKIGGVRSTTSRKKMNASRMSNIESPPSSTTPVGERRGSSSNSKRTSVKQEPVTAEATLAKQLAEKLLTNKWTSIHDVVITRRDETMQAYMESYRDRLNDIEKQEEKELQVEEKWHSNWTTSVNKIKQLYS